MENGGNQNDKLHDNDFTNERRHTWDMFVDEERGS